MSQQVQIDFAFALMGELLEPRVGVVAVDVGSKCMPGVVDHHFAGAGPDSAASLIVARPELVLDHVGAVPPERLTIVMHREPDLGSVTAAFLARALVNDGRLPDGSAAIAAYVREIDAGREPPDGVGPESLWALYAGAIAVLESRFELAGVPTAEDRYRAWVQRGFELLEAVLRAAPQTLAEVSLPRDVEGWDVERERIREETHAYQRDRVASRAFEIRVPCRAGGVETVRGLHIVDPASALFKHFARADGNVFTHVVYSGSEANRHVISVAPERGVWLRGLAAALEAQEVLVRAERGLVRRGPPRWEDVTCNDPWYDGRSPIHSYTIVDTPRGGTVLNASDISAIVHDTERWIPMGRTPDELVCPEGCRYPSGASARYCPRDGNTLLPSVIGARYEIVRLIGMGGMGVVYEARDLWTGLRYALKVLRRELMDRHEAWRDFVHEARMANRVGHPNVIRVHDFAADPSAGLFLVMEFIDGVALSDDIEAWSGQEKSYPAARMGSVLFQLCDALTELHAAGVLHRDLKPSNIMLVGTRPGAEDAAMSVKVLDFGIALLADPTATRVTTEGVAKGTVLYAAPEQLGGTAQLDARTDLYAVGTVLYELLCGRPPFAAFGPPIAVAVRKCSKAAPPLPRIHPELGRDPALLELLCGLLERTPERRRPTSALATRAALHRVAAWAASTHPSPSWP